MKDHGAVIAPRNIRRDLVSTLCGVVVGGLSQIRIRSGRISEVPYWWTLHINVIVLSAGQTVEPLSGAFGEEVMIKRTAHEWCSGY
jgi:hypothetical protein